MTKSKPSKRRAGASPLDALLGPVTPLKQKQETKVASKKVRATFHIPEDVLAAARDCVISLSGPPTRLTLAELCENALRREILRLEKEHNKGRSFPETKSKLRGGRPIGS